MHRCRDVGHWLSQPKDEVGLPCPIARSTHTLHFHRVARLADAGCVEQHHRIASEIEVHPNGKFVYGSNRGHDSIAVYSRDAATGKLTFVQHAPCGGKVPRHFAIDPSGKWMLIGHQDSNTISVLALDPEKGTLGEPTGTVSAPKPICLLFAK